MSIIIKNSFPTSQKQHIFIALTNPLLLFLGSIWGLIVRIGAHGGRVG
jgi:hypothetical protein